MARDVGGRAAVKTAYEWSVMNPVLVLGQMAYESDTKGIKVGDGANRYADLPYAGVIAGGEASAVTTKYTKQGHNGTGSWQFFRLANMPIDDTGNYAHVNIQGRIGGWVTENTALWDLLVMNRTNTNVGNVAGVQFTSLGESEVAAWICDLRVYAQTNKSAIVYLAVRPDQFYTFSVTVDGLQADIDVYTGEPESAVGTQVWSLYDNLP